MALRQEHAVSPDQLGVEHEWDHATVLGVRLEHEAEIAGSRNLRNLLARMRSNVYQGGPLRCIPELIQNGHDEGADEIRFVLTDDAILSYNNGRPFQRDQVRDICSIAQSHKDESQIGWMGLGFKSVFTVSEEPQVTSGQYNFHLQDLILPSPAAEIPQSRWLPEFDQDRGAWFRLPLKRKGAKVRQELLFGWKSISPNILLFLPGINRVLFTDAVKGSTWSIQKERDPDGNTVVNRSDTGAATRWRIFEKLHEKMSDTLGHKKHTPTIRIAFPIDPDTDCKGDPLYCYLPTGSPTGLNFLIHGDFGLSISRESILEDGFNRELLNSAGMLAADALTDITKDAMFAERVVEFVPVEGEVLDARVQVLEASMLRTLKKRKFVRSDNYTFVEPGHAVLGDASARRVVSVSDLPRLYATDARFLHPDLQTVRSERVLKRLGALQVVTEDVVRLLMERGSARKRTPNWFLDAYDFLQARWYSSKAVEPLGPAWLRELKVKPCVLTTARRLVPPTGLATGEMVSYPAGQGATELERTFRNRGLYVVHRELWPRRPAGGQEEILGYSRETEQRRERVKEFLCDGLGVRRQADVVAVVEEVILTRFENVDHLSFAEGLRLTDYIRRSLLAYQNRVQRSRLAARLDPTAKVREGLKVRCIRLKGGRKRGEWRSPDQTYLGRDYSGDTDLDELFKGVEGPAFVSPDCRKARDEGAFRGRGRSRTRIPSWPEFFESIGVQKAIAVRPIRREGLAADDPAFRWIEWPSGFPRHYKHSFARHRLDDWGSADLASMLSALTKLSKAQAISRAKALWRHLDRHWQSAYAGALRAKYSYDYYGAWRPSEQKTSTFRELLAHTAWVPVDGDQELLPPHRLYHRRNRPLLQQNVKYTALDGKRNFSEAIVCSFRLIRTRRSRTASTDSDSFGIRPEQSVNSGHRTLQSSATDCISRQACRNLRREKTAARAEWRAGRVVCNRGLSVERSSIGLRLAIRLPVKELPAIARWVFPNRGCQA